MRVQGVELRRVALPLKSPFRTSFGVDYENDVLLVRVEAEDAVGWGECVAGTAPDYSEEYVDGAIDALRRFMIPALLEGDDVRAGDVRHLLSWIKGHRMSKAALDFDRCQPQAQANLVRTRWEVSVVNGEEARELPPVIDLPTAGRLLGIGRSAAYELVRTGAWPTPVLRLGPHRCCGLANSFASRPLRC